jgi:hypothetical protein
MKTGPRRSAQAGRAAQVSVRIQVSFSATRVCSRWTRGEAASIRSPIAGEDIVNMERRAPGPNQYLRKNP